MACEVRSVERLGRSCKRVRENLSHEKLRFRCTAPAGSVHRDRGCAGMYLDACPALNSAAGTDSFSAPEPASRGFCLAVTCMKLNILIVDDEPSICRILQLLLQRAGHVVQIAPDGHEAFSAIAASRSAQFDVLITDHDMPVASGLDLVGRLAASGVSCRTIVCSAFLTPDLEKQYYGLGVSRCLTKPVVWEQLRDILHSGA